MVKLEKSKNGHDYDIFNITTEEGNFTISFENNLDLYWYYRPSKTPKEYFEKEFTITDEDKYIYECFDSLYEAIKKRKPFLNAPYDTDFKNKVDKYANCPYENGIIEWKSDDYPDDEASSVSIIKEENKFRVVFKPYDNYGFKTFFVRFRNSGSSYDPYNCTFMNM